MATTDEDKDGQLVDVRALSTEVQADLFQGLIDVLCGMGEAMADAGLMSRENLAGKLQVIVHAQVEAEGRIETPRQFPARTMLNFMIARGGLPTRN